MNYLKWVTPGWSFYGAGTTQGKLNLGWASWGMVERIGLFVSSAGYLSRLGLTLFRKLVL